MPVLPKKIPLQAEPTITPQHIITATLMLAK